MATTTLGSKAVGSIVKIAVGGTQRDFIVVHQGLPGSMYDASCNGTWLLMKDMYEKRYWCGGNSDYDACPLHRYLNDTYLGSIDENVRSKIKQVKIPYIDGFENSNVLSGESGLLTTIFLLSGTEAGFTQASSNKGQYLPSGEGARLAYFEDGTGTSAKNIRIAKLSGTAVSWWLRSPYTGSRSVAWFVDGAGSAGWHYGDSETRGVRPALVLPADLDVGDDGTVIVNTAPTTPGTITAPPTIDGGSTVTVSWTASTDAEGNLEGYKVERSIDGGSTWAQIYQGAGLSTTNTVAFGTETVMYRVCAYDSGGLASGWRTSAQVTVVNNHAPTAPASITVPGTVLGGSTLAVGWGAATDQDGDLSGYALERQVDGGAWAEIYRGSALTFTDTITRGWGSVAYRVRAYDSHGAYSGYTTSPARTVNNNVAPVITCATASGTDLGVKSAGFGVDYSASDADGDAVTITETVDGKPWRTFTAGAGQGYTLDLTGEAFMKLLNGAHSLNITANDGQVEAVHRHTFTKSVTSASVTLIAPMEADAQITICVLSVSGLIPSDAAYSVKVTNNANDAAPVWEDCTADVRSGVNHIFANQTAANGFAFNFKVEVERGPSGQGGYITSVQGGFQ